MQQPTRAAVESVKRRPEAEVLIIGGGINGIATLRELALQGIDVLLVERADFVSGASAASSHMVHGGIRYLENGELRLVREAVRERDRLLAAAPHLVTPLVTTIPIFSTLSGLISAPFRLLVTHGRGRPRERGALLIAIGLVLYETFSRGASRLPRHRFRGRRRSLRRFPQLAPSVRYTATYFDAAMRSPERLALDVLADGLTAGTPIPGAAEREPGGGGQQPGRAAPHPGGEASTARAVNYLSAVGLSDGAVRVRDELTGEEFSVRAGLVLNTTGPWTDLTNAALGVPSRYLGGTKGSHIVLDHPELRRAIHGTELFFEHSDGRIVLIFPLGDRVLVGTTDMDADPAEPPVCSDDEVEYFFDLVRHIFPRIRVDRSHIVFTFSGIRPLPKHEDTAPGFVSRDYRLEHERRGAGPGAVHIVSLVGGKWTTFRGLAERLGDEALRLLGRPRRAHTRTTPIGGGAGFPQDPAARQIWAARHGAGHEPALVEALLTRYGSRAAELLAELPAAPTRLATAPEYFAEELAILAREHVVHLDDLLLRRTTLAVRGGLRRETLVELAAAIAPALGWDSERQAAEVDRTELLLRERHRVLLGTPGLAPSSPASVTAPRPRESDPATPSENADGA